MSDIIEGAEEQPDESLAPVDDSLESTGDEVGLTSDEVDDDGDDEKKSLLQSMTIFDTMLLISLVCVGLATLLLLFELRTFGDFPSSFPWRTNEL